MIRIILEFDDALTTVHHFLPKSTTNLGERECRSMDVAGYRQTIYFLLLAEEAVFKLAPHPFHKLWKTAIICSHVACYWLIFGPN